MADKSLDSVTFDCPECGVRISKRYVGGVPESLECPSCEEVFGVDELAGLENTVRTTLPDTAELEAGRWSSEDDDTSLGDAELHEELVLEGDRGDTPATPETVRMWRGEQRVSDPTGNASSSPDASDGAESDATRESEPEQTMESEASATNSEDRGGESTIPPEIRASEQSVTVPPKPEISDDPSSKAEGTANASDGTASYHGGWRTVGVLFAVTLLLGGAVAYLELKSNGGDSTTMAAADTGDSADERMDATRPTPSVVSAVGAAVDHVRSARDIDVKDPQRLGRWARRLAGDGDHAAASRIYDTLWSRSDPRRRSELVDPYLASLEESSRWTRLRAVLVDAIQTQEKDEDYRRRFRDTIRNDPALGALEPVRIGDELAVDTLEPADDVEGWLLFRDGAPTHVFRPAAGDVPTWRDDIAAWRLCRILVCPFEIPETRAATITRERFEQLAGESPLPDDLAWSEEKRGGEAKILVRGFVRRWPAEVVRWPIERDQVWRRWLAFWGSETDFDRPAIEALREAWELEEPSRFDEIEAQIGDARVRRIARQLSTIVTFDFLVNNWGRFAEDSSNWGSHNHFGDGRFVTLWTGTVFQPRKSTRVEGRFHWIQRFSRDFVTAVRLLRRDPTFDALYPERSPSVETKLEIFWEQRNALLARVDSLVAEHDRSDVLFFE